jgi:hypothetical protein
MPTLTQIIKRMLIVLTLFNWFVINSAQAQQDNTYQFSAEEIQEAFKAYSDSDEVKSMIASARNQLLRKPNPYIVGKATYCYRAVKDALRASFPMGTQVIGGANARTGVEDLALFGFINLLDNPELNRILKYNPFMAPMGAILVYKTLASARRHISRAGHIEIKTENSGVDGYISISENNSAAYGLHPTELELIGVLIK